MSGVERSHLYLPARDRSFWKADDEAQPLLYLAWGARDFHRQPIPASRHEGWVCVLIEEGAPTMVVRRQAVRMPAGTLTLIGPDCPFGWKGATSGPSKFRLWMWRSFAGTRGRTDMRASYVSRLLARHERQPFLQLHDLCRREVLRPAGPPRRTSRAAASSSTRRSSANCSTDESRAARRQTRWRSHVPGSRRISTVASRSRGCATT